MRVFFLMLLFSFPALAQDMSALTDMTGRYAIGPWVGSVQGTSCLLGNDEPLAGASLLLTGAQGSNDIRVTLDDEPVTVDLDKEWPVFDINGHVFDRTGFPRALELLRQCMSKNQPATLPDEPLEESDPVASNDGRWQFVRLTMGGNPYAAFATLTEERQVSLGVWCYTRPDKFFLSITSLKGLTTRPEPFEAVLGLENGTEIKTPYFPQENGALIPLTSEQRSQIEASKTIHIRGAGLDETYEIPDFRNIIVGLQPYE